MWPLGTDLQRYFNQVETNNKMITLKIFFTYNICSDLKVMHYVAYLTKLNKDCDSPEV